MKALDDEKKDIHRLPRSPKKKTANRGASTTVASKKEEAWVASTPSPCFFLSHVFLFFLSGFLGC
jgi:hypothetical protein